MSKEINIYCDESCHIQHDHQQVMVLGAIWCPLGKSQTLAKKIRDIKVDYGFPAAFEIKWTKVSPGAIDFYLSLVDLFFDEDNLHFRALVVPDKDNLDHKSYKQTYDDWYYKMYFDMLKIIIDPQFYYNIYLDIKDTRGGVKVAKLHDVLANNIFDFSREILQKVQIIRSEETELIQLADLLIGAISYINRGLSSSDAKVKLVNRIRKKSNYTLTKTTLFRESKVNILIWQAS